jgi:hypothetical protein
VRIYSLCSLRHPPRKRRCLQPETPQVASLSRIPTLSSLIDASVHPKGNVFTQRRPETNLKLSILRIIGIGRTQIRLEKCSSMAREVPILYFNSPSGQITRSRIPSSFRSYSQSSCIRTLAGSTIEMIVRFAMLVLNVRARTGARRRAVIANMVTSFRG